MKTSGAVHLIGKTVALPTKLQSGLSAYRARPKSLIFTTPCMFSKMCDKVKERKTNTSNAVNSRQKT